MPISIDAFEQVVSIIHPMFSFSWQVKICEGIMSIYECKRTLVMMESNKTPGIDGLTSEFYRYFWNAVGKFMVESFNYAFQQGSLSIFQRQGIISLIPKKNKNVKYFWRPG